MSAPANRQLHIQGLRAIAVCVVVAFHAGLPVPGGFVGVDVFFVISGFVITAMLQREVETSGRIRFARFYMRRFKRLTPALALMTTVTCTLAAVTLSPLGPQQQAARTATGAVLLAANWVIAGSTGGYFDAPAGTNPLLNTWSLSVEEQFYLGFPLLMLLTWTWARRRGRPAHVPIAVAAVGVMSLLLALYGSRNGTSPSFLAGFYSPFARAWEFAAGALLALAPTPRLARRGSRAAAALGVLLLGAALFGIDGTTPFPSAWTMIPVAATALLIVAGGDGLPILGSRPFVRVGDWSYSIYLWHWPAIVFAGVLWPRVAGVPLLAAAIAVLPALLSYRFVEQPIRAREFPPLRFAALVVVTLAVPLLAAVGLHLAADHVWKPRVQAVAKPAAASAMHAGYTLGCHYEPGDGATDPQPCTWNTAQSGTPVYLLGDSNAAQFAEALIDATRALHRPLAATTSSGCPLLDIEMAGPDFPGYGRNCLARNLRLLRSMSEATPGTVVLAASADYWSSPGWTVTVGGRTTSDHRAMVRAMRASLQRVVRELQGTGHRVLLVQTIPHWVGEHAWDPSRCTLAAALHGCVQEMPVVDSLQRTADVRAAIDAVGRATGSTVLDVTAQVCPGGRCVTVNDEMPVYRDASHITVAMSHALAPQFEAHLR